MGGIPVRGSFQDMSQGKLKIYLGYAAGVGKTYQMLEEAQTLKSRGIDVAIGYFEPHGRKDTIAKTEGLEVIPRKKVQYRGSVFEEMDAEAIILRHPKVAVVDEFPHTNVPGSARTKRWEDVLLILENGIDVLDYHECAASGEPERPHFADHWHQSSRNHSRLGGEAGR